MEIKLRTFGFYSVTPQQCNKPIIIQRGGQVFSWAVLWLVLSKCCVPQWKLSVFHFNEPVSASDVDLQTIDHASIKKNNFVQNVEKNWYILCKEKSMNYL